MQNRLYKKLIKNKTSQGTKTQQPESESE